MTDTEEKLSRRLRLPSHVPWLNVVGVVTIVVAGLLIVTAVRLVDFKQLMATVRASRYDAGLVIVTALTGVLIDLDKAALLGIAPSILLFVPRAAKLEAAGLTVTPEGVDRGAYLV